MRILITGGSGTLGLHLIPALVADGHTVINVSRSPRSKMELSWSDPFPEVDCAIHLAGSPVGDKRWSPAVIAEARASRLETAKILRSKLTSTCRLIITASGANCYPFDGTVYDESGPYGDTICGALCRDWEAALTGLNWQPRHVALRLGFVLVGGKSELNMIADVYRAGFGGSIGSGRQRYSWIAMADLVRIFQLVIAREDLRGPINAVAPTPVAFRDFNRALGQLLHRPSFCWMPGFVMRALYGKMADELILADYPTTPRKLLDAGFEYLLPEFPAALAAALAPHATH